MVTVNTQLSVRRDPLGRPQDYVESAMDVVAQRPEHDDLNAELSHRRTVFRAIPVSVWDVDLREVRAIALSWLKGDITDLRKLEGQPERIRDLMRATYVCDVNDKALELFAAGERDDILGSVERFWPESGGSDFLDWLMSGLAGEPGFVRETCLRRCDGGEFDALFTASTAPGLAEEGRSVVTIFDYSTVKRGRAAFRKSEAFYADMFHGSAISTWQLDTTEAQAMFADLRRQGVTDFRAHVDQNPNIVFRFMDAIKVVDVNDMSLTLFGAAHRNEVVGGSIAPFWIPDRLETLVGSLEASFNNEAAFKSSTRMRTLSGGEIDVLYTKAASGTLRNAGQLLLAIVDVTDRVQAQTALAEMQATSAHAARVSSLGELTASIAHEVNQPLTAITANGEAVLRWLSRPAPDLERLRRLTAGMIADARRASDVIGHIRSMASPQVQLHRPISMRTLIEEALTLLASQLRKSGVVVTREHQPDLANVLGDHIQLQQVIVNLVMNALQAMDGVADPRLLLRTGAEEMDVVLVVADNGPGIRLDDADKLFNSFFTTKPDGMGIGLAICRTIVEAHGGRISASNGAERGACLTVRLPRAKS